MKKYLWKVARWLHHLDFAYALPLMVRLPLKTAYTLGRWRGLLNGATGRDWRTMALGFRHIQKQTRIAYAELAPEATEAQRETWCRQRFMAEAMDEFEARWMSAGRGAELTCEFDPPNALDYCRDRSRGLVMLTPHFESFFLGASFLARSGETVNAMSSAVTQDPRVDEAVQRHFHAKYRGLEQYLNGGKVINMEEGLRPFYEMLKRQEMLVVLADAPVLPNGASMTVRFLGAARKIAGGALRIAQRTDSDIGAYLCIPVRKGHYKIVFLPPAPAQDPDTIQRIYDFFTENIMSHPGGWLASDLLHALPKDTEEKPTSSPD
ncbi:hypothetical protein [Acidovorax sp. CCYZU-2555]|uniref:lysophospholipid acyltransferase family protein n=1 Tax=Acidovorax sp. CCYZU-2555 TaxID=2835042 RepID=UPI001BCE682C|nr:hypothetical protein [Acidovorax sp. CCYZU-2555]